MKKRSRVTALLLCAVLALQVFLVSCGGEEDEIIGTESSGEYGFTLYGEGDRIKSIRVERNGRAVCVLKADGTNFTLIDLNFDGVDDIRLDSAEKGRYLCYLCSPEAGRFSKNSALSGLIEPVWDGESKTVTALVRKTEIQEVREDGTEEVKQTRATAVWGFIGGAPIQLSEDGIEYFSGSGIYCVYTCRSIGGEITRIDSEDRWFFSLDALVAAGYSWEK